MGVETMLIIGAASSLYSGVSSMQAGKAQARLLKSQAELMRIENNEAADRYQREAKGFKAEQSVKFLKSGVRLTGSPLDILDETSRIASENVSAIRAAGEANAVSLESKAKNVEAAGRRALIGGLAKVASAGTQYTYGKGMGLYGSGQKTGFDIQAEGDYTHG